jgi:putative Mg2+ transporter-C (MgtC) family protein
MDIAPVIARSAPSAALSAVRLALASAPSMARWAFTRATVTIAGIIAATIDPIPQVHDNSDVPRGVAFFCAVPRHAMRRVSMLDSQQTILRLVIAAAAGSVIGFERERLQWAAGLRTHMLVCVGSCLVMIVSAFGFSDVLHDRNVVLDPSRIAAQVVSGIGFLGAGTILLRGEVVRGLTTAASLWAVAAIGLAVGAGLYVAALSTTVIALVILAGVKPIEDYYRTKLQSRSLTVVAKRGTMTIASLTDTIGARAMRVKQFVQQQDEGADLDLIQIVFTRLSREAVDNIAARLRGLPTVVSVEWT